MVSRDQDFTVVRGDDVLQPFTVTLDQSRVLDGTETWRFQIRTLKSDGTALVSLVSPTQILITAVTYQPVVVFLPSTLTLALFPPNRRDRGFSYDLEMTKDSKVETVSEGIVTVITDVSR